MIPTLESLELAKPEAKAIQAVASGSATAEQQRLAIAVIREKICAEPQLSMSGNAELTAFHEGRRFVGVMIRRVIPADLSIFKEVKHG